jgi:hypothetical protein
MSNQKYVVFVFLAAVNLGAYPATMCPGSFWVRIVRNDLSWQAKIEITPAGTLLKGGDYWLTAPSVESRIRSQPLGH